MSGRLVMPASPPKGAPLESNIEMRTMVTVARGMIEDCFVRMFDEDPDTFAIHRQQAVILEEFLDRMAEKVRPEDIKGFRRFLADEMKSSKIAAGWRGEESL